MSTHKNQFWSFKRARSYVRKLEIGTMLNWYEYRQSGQLPNTIPKYPERVYKDQGWLGYRDWLTDTKNLVSGRYLPFKKARSFARKLGFTKNKEWSKYAASGKKPDNIPSCPERVYAEIGWIHYGDWLGSGKQPKSFLPYEEAKTYVHTLKLNNKQEWKAYVQSGRLPPNIPKDPYTVYRHKGYQGMGDWLGSGFVHTRHRTYRPFEKARAWVRKQKFKNYLEWLEFVRSDQLPDDIPRTPQKVYAEKWKSLPDWIGNNGNPVPRYRPDRTIRVNRSFKSARKFARSLNLKSKDEWIEYTRSGACPPDIPSDPRVAYKEWISYADWLGINKKHKRFSKS